MLEIANLMVTRCLSNDDLQNIAQLLHPIKAELADMKTELGGVHTQVGGIGTELTALQAGVREMRTELTEFRTEVNAQFNEVQNNFEGLYARDEKREQEYLLLRGQIARLEERVDAIEKKVA